MSKELAKAYEPKEVEDRIYDFWMKGKYFHAEVDPKKKPYTIVIPPPNITGQLHLGHAMDETLQDTLIRWRRMQGYSALWLPGTDHASIATEAKIVEAMRKEGITKEEIGREKFLERAWAWKDQYGGRIVEQLKKLGSSCDWDRLRFTMDEGCNKAVNHVFKKLYDKGLIYRGERIINWCPHCKTSISDAEVVFEEKEGSFWHLRYPLSDGSGYIELATTRPETMLGDTAVAVHPDDERYKALVGKTVILPLVNKEIPIIADSYVEQDFGTGVVKITPAHDPNDFEVGLRHNLPVINVMDDGGVINENGGKYAGMPALEARKQIVKDLDEAGFLIKIEPIKHNVGTCYRCGTVVEPRVSTQWFVKMEPLAKPAIDAVKDGDIRFIPERMDKVYYNWMENIKDWCISRQLWWGHRIPAWYLPEGGYVVAETAEEALELARRKCGADLQLADLRQDDDVLDTWFSSWLWPIALFDGIMHPGNPEIRYYYPTNDLVTAPDIIFFWVARMIMAGYEYMHEKPFQSVYFTGLVRDKLGRKMSKSLGNSPDPLDLIDRYGADGVRVAMLLCSTAGNDIMFDEAMCEQGRNFGNKIWNAFRLVSSWSVDEGLEQPESGRLAAEWFGNLLDRSLAGIEADFAAYRISDAFMKIYRLFWDEFSGWYLEMVKPAYGMPADGKTFAQTKAFFDKLLRMLHPFMPFITEELWQHLAPRLEGQSIMVSDMPRAAAWDDALLARFELVKETVTAVRNIRQQKSIPTREPLALKVIRDENYHEAYNPLLVKMANLSGVKCVAEKSPAAPSFIVKTTEYFVPLDGMVDVEAELRKLADELAYLEGFLASVMKKLSNERFVSGAPQKVVETEYAKKNDAEAKIKALRERMAALK